jgi:nitrate reductase / nitrite oxidoreductase, alpha subunit
VAEGYVDINPGDAKELGVEDGDYVWIDPTRRTGRSAAGRKTPDYEFSRLLCRARYYPGTPRGVTRMWFNMYGATPGSQRGPRTTGRAGQEPATQYQAMFRSGSHQSATRGWLKPTWMTDSLVRKNLFGQGIGKGFCPTSTARPARPARRSSRSPAEPGGWTGKGCGGRPRWASGPAYESRR